MLRRDFADGQVPYFEQFAARCIGQREVAELDLPELGDDLLELRLRSLFLVHLLQHLPQRVAGLSLHVVVWILLDDSP